MNWMRSCQAKDEMHPQQYSTRSREGRDGGFGLAAREVVNCVVNNGAR